MNSYSYQTLQSEKKCPLCTIEAWYNEVRYSEVLDIVKQIFGPENPSLCHKNIVGYSDNDIKYTIMRLIAKQFFWFQLIHHTLNVAKSLHIIVTQTPVVKSLLWVSIAKWWFLCGPQAQQNFCAIYSSKILQFTAPWLPLCTGEDRYLYRYRNFWCCLFVCDGNLFHV